VGQGVRWRRRLVVFVLVTVLAVLGVGFGRYELLPHYRPSLRSGERYGIDVSNHQGNIDWKRVAASHVSFAYIKATEGSDFLDKQFSTNWANARAAGINRGAYHFFTLCSSGAAQAKNFLSVIPADPEALPPAVDLEFSACRARPDNATVQRELRTFLDAVEYRLRRPVIVYILPSFEKVYPIDRTLLRDSWQRRLFRRPAQASWTIWQASDVATVNGIQGPVDLDVQRSSAGP
jgi:lysozyme